jgi:hypothetical protein
MDNYKQYDLTKVEEFNESAFRTCESLVLSQATLSRPFVMGEDCAGESVMRMQLYPVDVTNLDDLKYYYEETRMEICEFFMGLKSSCTIKFSSEGEYLVVSVIFVIQ